MKKLDMFEAQALADVLEKVIDSMEEYDEGYFSSGEDLLITMDAETLVQCKVALGKLTGVCR